MYLGDKASFKRYTYLDTISCLTRDVSLLNKDKLAENANIALYSNTI